MTYDPSDPIHVIQVSIENGWPVALGDFTAYYTGGGQEPASPDTANKDTQALENEHCVIDFGDAQKDAKTNISVIWNVPVTIKVHGVSEASLRPLISRLKSFLGGGESSLSQSGLTVVRGGLSEVRCSRVSYEKVAANKAKAEFEVNYRLVLPVKG